MDKQILQKKFMLSKLRLNISVIPFHVMKLMILDTKYLEILNSMSTMLIKQT